MNSLFMIYFAYGPNMFTYRLEKRVGKTSFQGIGRLPGYKLALNKLSRNDGSLKANAVYTGNPNDIILGILFNVDDKKLPVLDKEEGGYKRTNTKIEKLENDDIVESSIYIAKPKGDISDNLPFDWYIELILAGAKEHKMPTEYIEYLKSFPFKICENEGLKSTALFILTESTLLKKTINEAMEIIETLNKEKTYIVNLPGHALNGREMAVYRGNKEFKYKTSTKIPKGIQKHRELNVQGKTIILNNGKETLYVDGKDLLIDRLSYDTDNSLKLTSGTLNAFSTIKEDIFNNKYLRLIIPTERCLEISRHMQSIGYTVNYHLHGGLLITSFNNNTYHFYSLKHKDGCFACIDSVNITDLGKFQSDCNTILLTYAFLIGTYSGDEGYFIGFDDETQTKMSGIFYHTLQGSIQVKGPVFTTNPYIGLSTASFREDENRTSEQEKEKYRDLKYFPWKAFTNICELAAKNEKILRTLTFLVENQSSRQEIVIPLQYVALETISAVLSEGDKELKPIEDPELADELLIKLAKTVTDFIAEKEFTEIGRLNPILSKIKNLNSPLNADKLSKAFASFGYTLTEEEQTFISNRNPFLHGSIRTFKGKDITFNDLFYLSLRLNFLIAVLLLKKAGFNGRIINYAKLYDYITDRYLEEDVLKLI